MAKSRVAHDHIVLLLGRDEFENPPAWLTDNFNIIEGGTHAGGSSRNKLIIFKDGTYLELFTWITEPKEFLAWADKPAGLIDFALTTIDPATAKGNYETITTALKASEQAAKLGISYSAPQAGGRKRMDGVDVKWETTRPQFGVFTNPPDEKYLKNSRLDTPFFCHDVTDRTVRVPFTDESITKHACGAIGIASVKIVVPESHIDSYLAFYRALLGVKEQWFMDEMHEGYSTFKVSAPNPDSHSHETTLRIYHPTWTESWIGRGGGAEMTRQENEQQKWLTERGPGIYGLILRGEGETSAHDIGSLGKDEIGASILLEPWMGRCRST